MKKIVILFLLLTCAVAGGIGYAAWHASSDISSDNDIVDIQVGFDETNNS